MSYKNLLSDTITYWAPGTPDGFGTKSFKQPVHLKARYQNSRLELIDQMGQSFISIATVYVDSSNINLIEFGGFISLGVYSGTTVSSISTAYRVARISTSKSPKTSIKVYRIDLG